MYNKEEYLKNKEKIKLRQREYYWRKKKKKYKLEEVVNKTVVIRRGEFFIYI